MTVRVLTDDLDLAGHHLRDWRYLSDIPQSGATTGQALVWNGKSWAPGTVSGGTSGSVDWADITSKPLTFTPEAHTHVIADITDWPLVFTPDTHTHVAADVTDLGSVALLRADNDWWDGGTPTAGRYVSELVGTDAWLLAEDLLDGHKFVTNVMDLPLSYGVISELALKASSTHTHTAFNNNVTINSGFSLKTNTVGETTGSAGVTVDGVLLKDNEVYTNVVKEGTSGSGVTADGVLLKDNGVTSTWTTVGATRTNMTSSMALVTSGAEFGTTYRLLDVPLTINAAAGTTVLQSFNLLNLSVTVTNNTPGFYQPSLSVISSTVNAGALNISIPSGSVQPVHFVYTNPGNAQAFGEGYFSVDVAGTTGTVVAAYTRARVSGSAIGVGYLGYAVDASGSTGTITGVNGYVVISAGSTSTAAMSFDSTVVGSAITYDKRMSLRGSNHVLIRGGSLILATGTPATPGAVSTTHLTLTAGNSNLFVGGAAEVDGEMFMDGNTSISVASTTSTSYTAAAVTVILANANSAAITVTLPAASGKAGRLYTVKKTDASANTVTVDGNASETIDGATTKVLTAQYEVVRLICDGSNWHII